MLKFSLVLYFLFSITYSQTTLVKYSHDRLFTDEQLNHPKYGERNTIVKEYTKLLNLYLIFDDNLSYYKCDKNDQIDADFDHIYVGCKCFTDIYQKSNKFYYHNIEDFVAPTGKYIIEESMINSWNITEESKMINNFKCFKATATRIEYAGEKELKYPIVAWFCPEIPSSFGPAGYGNLPGLIFQIEDGIYAYYLKEIIRNYKDNIKFDLKGEPITFEDYMKKSKEKEYEMMME